MSEELKFTIDLDAEHLKSFIKKFVESEYGIKDAEVVLLADTKYDSLNRGVGKPRATGAKITASLPTTNSKSNICWGPGFSIGSS